VVSKQYRAGELAPGGSGYNLPIPNVISNSVSCVPCPAPTLRIVQRLAVTTLGILIFGVAVAACAADWSAPEQQLARKIVAVTRNGAVSLTFENRGSLGLRDAEIIQNGLRSALAAMGARLVEQDASGTPVRISLSENLTSYVWVAQIVRNGSDPIVVMVSMPRPANDSAHESVPLSLRKTLVWSQSDPILDVAVLEENAAPLRIAVLDAKGVSLYRSENGRWTLVQSLLVSHTRPWPRDLRGRLAPAKDHLLDIYLPGVVCHSVAGKTNLSCGDSDDPWPIGAATQVGNTSSNTGGANGTSPLNSAIRAFFGPSYNFFTGALTPPAGTITTVPKFYSAAFVQRETGPMWIFASVDGGIHVVDGPTGREENWNWGSDQAGVRTSCGAGAQVLATPPNDGGNDSVRAFEFPDRDPVAVTASVDFSGPISALWTEPKGDTAVAIAKNQETGNYEAFRLAVVCSQ